MGQPRIDSKRGTRNPDKDLEEVKTLLPTKGPGIWEQIPAHAYGPPARCVDDSWSSDTLREKIEHLDKELIAS